MCIVLDTNCFSKVFNARDAEHKEFQPVLNWILEKDGCLVYGGTKYKQELAAARRYLTLFAELEKLRKVRLTNDADTDARQVEIEKIMDAKKHNDPHLPAIICQCGCRLVCTDDGRSCSLLKDRRCYPKHISAPRLYMSARNVELLCADNIAEFCKPVTRLNKDAKALFAAARD